jgi:hypothetical protein
VFFPRNVLTTDAPSPIRTRPWTNILLEPTTIAPTTASPSTSAPTTVSPTTMAPSTQAPTTHQHHHHSIAQEIEIDTSVILGFVMVIVVALLYRKRRKLSGYLLRLVRDYFTAYSYYWIFTSGGIAVVVEFFV